MASTDGDRKSEKGDDSSELGAGIILIEAAVTWTQLAVISFPIGSLRFARRRYDPENR
jgi:hypothetical protein